MSMSTQTVSVPLPNIYSPVEMSVLEDQVSFLKGKVLTVIDAAISDQEQRKAVKDLIKNAFQDQMDYVRSSHYADSKPLAVGRWDGNNLTNLQA